MTAEIGSIMRKCYLYSYKDIKESKKGLSKKSVQKVKKKGNRADEYFFGSCFLCTFTVLARLSADVFRQFLAFVGIQNEGLVQFGNAAEFYGIFGLHVLQGH